MTLPAEITGQRLAALLCQHGIIDSAAVDDPEGYDNYRTLEAINAIAKELNQRGLGATLYPISPDWIGFAKAVSRSACLKQEFDGHCICFSCEAKRLLNP